MRKVEKKADYIGTLEPEKQYRGELPGFSFGLIYPRFETEKLATCKY